MSLIGSVGGLNSPYLTRLQPATRTDSPEGPVKLPGISTQGTQQTQGASFGNVFDQLVSSVDAKQDEATNLTREVLLGKNDQLHQSMIAMQEAGVAFQLMVEVRNKVVESYQELMRMPA
jgi:flagellar hook-basal body complex protein FliE